MHNRLPAAFILFMCLSLCAGRQARASDAPLPTVLAGLTSFHGDLTYRARPVDDPSAVITGTLTVRSDGWVLDEHSACCQLHASSRDSWIRSGSQMLVFDDPLDVGALANSWALLLAMNVGAHVSRDAGGTSWTTGARTRFYLSSDETEIVGASDGRSRVAFSFSQWVDVDGLRVPQSIVRLRGEVTDRSFVIDEYRVQWAPAESAAPPANATRSAVAEAAAVAQPGVAKISLGRRLLGIVFVLLFTSLLISAWTRRDAFIERVAHRVATDPRAWRREGVSVFVSPEGALTFEGCTYWVGALFFNRQVLVQSSPLFIRVTAPGEPRALILARKFPAPDLGFVSRRRAAPGFTLIESLTAMAVFASVIIAAVFPTLIVLARADQIAAQRQLALQIATNALTDEQAGLAYGYSLTDGSAVSTVDGMTLTETLTPSRINALYQLAVEVTDAQGESLARIVTLVGPPVPPPGGPTPPPSPPASPRPGGH